MFIKIITLALFIILALIVLAIPFIVGAFIEYKWDNLILAIVVGIVGYTLMISSYVVITEGQLNGEGEIVGIEHIPAHTESSVKTSPVIINGKTSIITTPSEKFKEEAYIIHVRKKTDSKYKRYMLEITKEEFENMELGQKVNLNEYERYD